MPSDSSSSSSSSSLSAPPVPAPTPISLPNFSEFELHPRETAPTRFEKYVKRLDNLFVATNITRATQKRAIFLHYVGEETCDVVDTLVIPEPPEGSDEYQTLLRALADHFEPQKCVDHHVYVFRQETQKAGENITEFYTRLRLLARKCEFTDPPLEIKRQIIQGTTSVRLRRKTIEQGLSLEKLLKTARAMETADEQTSEMEKQHSHAVVHNRNKIADKKPKRDARPKAGSHHTKCGLCGGNYPHQGNCPAQGKNCHNCGKPNHFSWVCRSKPNGQSKPTNSNQRPKGRHHARAVSTDNPSAGSTSTPTDDTSDDSEEYTFHIVTQEAESTKPIFQVKILDTTINVMADSGATVNILCLKDFETIRPEPIC